MIEMLMRKDRLGVLRPLNGIAEQYIRDLPSDQIVSVQVKMPRNVGRHNYYWALIGETSKHTEYTNEQLHDLVKVMCGHCEPLTAPNGYVWWRPKSISFAKMSEPEFVNFLDRVIVKLCEILGCQPDELLTAAECEPYRRPKEASA
jgi:hypothetical protein